MLFLGSLSIQCRIRCNRPSDTRWSTGWCNQPATCWPPLVYFSVLSAFPFGQNFEHFSSSFIQSTFAKRQFEFV